jgi:hypothetical protein
MAIVLTGSRIARTAAASAIAGGLWVTPAATTGRQSPAPVAIPAFAAEVAALSEPGGYFDTDNLISNERSYLHAISDLTDARVRGGAYVGVGPDQNFSYVGHVRPAIAFMLDIRRDNLLLHLLFKALFGLSRTRVEYLSLLFGRAPPEPLTGWESKSIDALVSQLDTAKPLSSSALTALRSRVADKVASFGVPLSAGDRQTIDRFHQQFITAGLSLQFHSTGRAPQYDYPNYRDLMLEVDRAGQRRSYLASEAAFQYVKGLQDRDLVIPVVGNLAGPSALVAIGKSLGRRNERLSAFYASNVEFYLFQDDSFARFVSNLKQIPRADTAVVIRSFFGRAGLMPTRPGDNSVSQLQSVDDLLKGVATGSVRTYSDLVVR